MRAPPASCKRPTVPRRWGGEGWPYYDFHSWWSASPSPQPSPASGRGSGETGEFTSPLVGEVASAPGLFPGAKPPAPRERVRGITRLLHSQQPIHPPRILAEPRGGLHVDRPRIRQADGEVFGHARRPGGHNPHQGAQEHPLGDAGGNEDDRPADLSPDA